MATTEDYARLGLEGLLALCRAEWGTLGDDVPDNPVARALDCERRLIERRHAERRAHDRRHTTPEHCPVCGECYCGFGLRWLGFSESVCKRCHVWLMAILNPSPVAPWGLRKDLSDGEGL